MRTISYQQRRGQIETYFDRTAVEAWRRLTSDAPVSGIRATVRAGRDRMRAQLLDWLPEDLTGRRVLDAGCGTGALAVAAAERGAQVVAVDLSPSLIDLARERSAASPLAERIVFLSGDMLAPDLGSFDHIVAMDSLIHYPAEHVVRILCEFTARARASVLFTYAPSTPLLSVMHTCGRWFPRADRAPAIEPIAERQLHRLLVQEPALNTWRRGRSERIASGFYTSQALELVRR